MTRDDLFHAVPMFMNPRTAEFCSKRNFLPWHLVVCSSIREDESEAYGP